MMSSGAFEIFLRREGTRQLLAPKLPPPERIGFICSRFPRFLSGGFTAWARKVWEQRHQPVDFWYITVSTLWDTLVDDYGILYW